MKRLTACLCIALLAACAASDDTADTEMDSAAPTIALADVAGTWAVRAYADDGDSAIVTYDLVMTENMEGWTMTFPDREPIPMRVVSVAGDSIVTQAGPFPSALREGVMVTANSVSRLQDGKLMGTFMARYETTEADSVLRGRAEGTRKY